ncbi:MAG TPA: serine/threonine-protein kinase [Vicinamibacterales bacterium]|jgi:tRNA A-37 threonylcarbamoyl transferase component Bud32|nr:serine/threonine-protein kinase [Vicinamibacterales bacterium]
MTPERWQRVSELYEAVLDRPAGEREAFLAEACAGDSALRHEIHSLLAQDDGHSPLDAPVWVPDDLGEAADYNAGFPQPMRLAAGTRLGPYEIQSAIGAGGMGEVYRGRDTRLDRAVAVKVLRPDVAADPAFRARFDREARTISQLDHPNICPLFDIGEQDGTAYLVMPLLEGESLADRVRRGPLPLPAALRIAIGLASALTYAHGRGVLHRDVKPHNVLMLADGRTMLLDFGIAKPYGLESIDTMADTSPALTRLGQTLGTLEYMAPEQLGGRIVDGRSDMFSLGIVIAEIVSGTHPFRGSTPAVTASAILDRPYQGQPDATGPDADLDRIVRRMLARQPADRFPTMADCLAELRLLEHDSGARTALAAARPPRRTRVGVVAAVLLLATIAGVAVWRSRTGPAAISPPAPAAALAPAVAPSSISLTFWLDVKPNPEAPAAALFQSNGEQRYPSGSLFRVTFVAPAGTHVYVLADDAPASDRVTLMYPRADSEGPDASGMIATDWIAFEGPPATDRLWLLSSTAAVAELDTVAKTLRSERDSGVVSDATILQRVRTLLADETRRARVARDTSNVQTLLSGGPVIVHRLDLSHD